MTTDTKIEELIAEAREWPRDGVNEGRLINGLADALEQVTAERDAALSAIREALDVPPPSGGFGVSEAWRAECRLNEVQRILSRVLDGQEKR